MAVRRGRVGQAAFVVVANDEWVQGLQRDGEPVELVAVHDGGAGTRVIDDVRPRRGEPDVDGDGDEPGIGQAEGDLWPFDAVAGDHDDAVAGLKTPVEQDVGQSTGTVVQLRPGMPPVTID